MQPILNPATQEPIDPKMLEALFPKELIRQEVSQDRYVQIPEQVQDVYRLYRQTPIFRTRGLEKAVKTPAKIGYNMREVYKCKI